MSYVSIDIETLGFDENTCSLLEVGMVIEDLTKPVSELPRFQCYNIQDLYAGQIDAFAMHSEAFQNIKNRTPGFNYVDNEEVALSMFTFLEKSGYFERSSDGRIKVVLGGKNVANFDLKFLRKLPRFEKCFKVNHRMIDAGSAYYNPLQMKEIPSLDQCLEIAGIEKKVSHTAVDDALDVIRVMRKYWGVPCE